MLVHRDQTRNETVQKRTVDGFLVNINLLASEAEVILNPTQYGAGSGFDAAQVNIKAMLRRGDKEYILFHDNLGILGQFNSFRNGGKNWYLGTDIVRPSEDDKHHTIRTLFLALGGHLNLSAGDQLYYEVTVGRSAFGSSVDGISSYVQVTPHYSIGKELGVFQTRSKAIQAGDTRVSFDLGSNVTEVAFINLEDTTVANQIIQNLNFGSDRNDFSASFGDLININSRYFQPAQFLKYYDYSTASSEVDTYQPAFPQSFLIHADEAVDELTLDITFDPLKVNAARNYVVYRSFVTSKEIIAKAAAMADKHAVENIQKLPDSL